MKEHLSGKDCAGLVGVDNIWFLTLEHEIEVSSFCCVGSDDVHICLFFQYTYTLREKGSQNVLFAVLFFLFLFLGFHFHLDNRQIVTMLTTIILVLLLITYP